MLSSQYESTLCSSCSRSPFLSVSFLVALVSLPHLSPLKWELWEVGNLFVLLSDASSVSGMVPEQVLHTCVVWTSWLAHILSWLLLLGAFRTLGSSIFNKWRKGEGQWTPLNALWHRQRVFMLQGSLISWKQTTATGSDHKFWKHP